MFVKNTATISKISEKRNYFWRQIKCIKIFEHKWNIISDIKPMCSY